MTRVSEQGDGVHRPIIGVLYATKVVVGLPYTVDADLYGEDIGPLQPLYRLFGDQGPVLRRYPLCGRVVQEQFHFEDED